MADETIAASGGPVPLLRVVRGEPSAEELAALVAVVASLGAPAAAPPARRTPEWNANRRMQRPVLRAGRGAWRASSLPR